MSGVFEPGAMPVVVSLAQLKSRQAAHVYGIDGDPATDTDIQRLLELGFHNGTPVCILHRGPFGGNPLSVQIGAMVVALRKAEASRIHVETVA